MHKGSVLMSYIINHMPSFTGFFFKTSLSRGSVKFRLSVSVQKEAFFSYHVPEF